jgi:hypothetical protein
MNETISQLRKTKTLLSVVLLVVAGAALIALGHRIQDATAWYGLLPLTELGGILVGAGILSVWLDAYLSREQNQLEEHRLRSILTEQAPVMRDAVLQAFAANHDDLKRVATPELLDGIISNSLALRLNSAEFAHEIYTDIRDQAIRAAERWHDANLSIQLAPLPMGSGTSKRRPTSSSSPNLFSVTVRWEYTTIPGHQQRRFVCTADRAEYDELANSNDGTTGWYIGPSSNVDAATTEAFELLTFTVDGDQRPIRRSARKHGQTYSVPSVMTLCGPPNPSPSPTPTAPPSLPTPTCSSSQSSSPPGTSTSSSTTRAAASPTSAHSTSSHLSDPLASNEPQPRHTPTPSESTSMAGSSRDREWRLCGRLTAP